MTTGRDDDELLETLRTAQRFGVLGPVAVEEALAHARSFVAALASVTGRVVDLGSGGGLPGLVVAWDRPDLDVVLVDRRAKRTDLLARAVRRLGLDADVRCEDVRTTIRREGGTFDAATARSFGPPEMTLSYGVRLVRPRGVVVISEPPQDDRWSPSALARLGVERERVGPVSVFRETRTG